jgi:anaerobic selenocysteine-containing dehydrogenase
MLGPGSPKASWVQGGNGPLAATDTGEPAQPHDRDPERFIVVSAAYPTGSARTADLILPTAICVEKAAAWRQPARRARFRHRPVEAPGEARSELWQIVEFAKRFTTRSIAIRSPPQTANVTARRHWPAATSKEACPGTPGTVQRRPRSGHPTPVACKSARQPHPTGDSHGGIADEPTVLTAVPDRAAGGAPPRDLLCLGGI